MSRSRRPFARLALPSAALVMLAAILAGCAATGAGAAASADRPFATSTGGGTASGSSDDPSTAAPASAPDVTARPKGSRPLNVPPPNGAAAARAYADFLARVRDDQSTVDGLDRDLTNASNAADLDGVREAAVAILDFVDVERDWLLGHPPADCYADAHASAMAMLEAYGAAGERFVDWSATGGGLGGLPALGRAADAATTAQAALTTFGSVLGRTSCPS